jgi:hypothetical protein
MPSTRSQTVNSDGFELQTQTMGLLKVVLTLAGNITTVTCLKDGVQVQAPTVTNATAGVLETLINNFMNGQILGVGSLKPFYNACHIVTMLPTFKCQTITGNVPITGTWWVNG